ncbi:pirin family protein [Streptomyces sp. HSG2]|uniref:pirin family protein n=1 Tax=Streptomyces sp. HSG2 TaxID=2797167 RepID=UPI001907DCA9|nr:pirin family protein [Streptomyces sp. HSG2]
MIDVRRAGERYRGGDAASGIESRHAFSFGPHYDPDNLGFGALVACNEERLAPGAGFDEHGHRDTEIVTWVVEGELTHRDSAGHSTVLRAGDAQVLGAGAGVRHVERNDGTAPLTFVQMWLTPRRTGGEPSHRVVRGLSDAMPLAVPGAGATLLVRRPRAGRGARLPAGARGYAHVARGSVRLGEARLEEGDAARLTDVGDIEAVALTDAEILMWRLSQDQR